MARLIQITVDVDDLIVQYNWLSDAAVLYNVPDKEAGYREITGLQNLLEGLMFGLWGDTTIYDNGGETHDRYLVIMPGRNDTYHMSHDPGAPNGVCATGGTEGALKWEKLGNGDMIPFGYSEEVSIINAPKGVRRQVLKVIEEDLEYYEDHLVIT